MPESSDCIDCVARIIRSIVESWLCCAGSCCIGRVLSRAVGRCAQQPAETTIPDKVRLFIPYKEYSQEDNKRILEMYKWLRVADVSDGMDVVGLQDIGTVDPEIHALWKDTEKFTHRTVGIAVTARYVPTNRREPKMDQKTISQWYSTITSEAFMKVLQPGSDARHRRDGGRRIAEHRIVEHPLVEKARHGRPRHERRPRRHRRDHLPQGAVWFRRLARGIRPGRNELESVNRPVTVGGVLVRPGDVVVADGDGVVVVPRERAEEVAKAALPFLDNITRERYIKETGQQSLGEEAWRHEHSEDRESRVHRARRDGIADGPARRGCGPSTFTTYHRRREPADELAASGARLSVVGQVLRGQHSREGRRGFWRQSERGRPRGCASRRQTTGRS